MHRLWLNALFCRVWSESALLTKCQSTAFEELHLHSLSVCRACFQGLLSCGRGSGWGSGIVWLISQARAHPHIPPHAPPPPPPPHTHTHIHKQTYTFSVSNQNFIFIGNFNKSDNVLCRTYPKHSNTLTPYSSQNSSKIYMYYLWMCLKLL